MRCVTSVSYSIKINDTPQETFYPSRGVRQGDPLSPYLFLFCAEALSTLIKQAETDGQLHGIIICRRAPSVSHLFFADDILLFKESKPDEVRVVRDILQLHEKASQCVNLDKSEMSFGANVSSEMQDTVCHILSM